MSSLQRIRGNLSRIRRRQAERRVLTAAAATLWSVLLALSAGSLLLGLVYETGLRLLVFVSLGVGVAWVWGRFAVLPVWRTRRPGATARLLERHFATLRNDVTSSLEFGTVLEERGSDDETVLPGSPQLMRALVERTADRLSRRADAFELGLPREDVPRLRRLGLGAGFLFAVALLTLPQVAQVGLDRLVSGLEPLATAATSSGALAEDPLVTRISVEYRYPTYTRRGTVALNNPTGRVEVLAGTEVTLRAETLIEARRAALVLRTGGVEGQSLETEIDMQVTGRELAVTFTALSSATYTFELTDLEQRRRVDPIERTVEVIPDAVPQAHVIAPDSVVEAAPGDAIPFRFTVSDDFGLTELAFVHAFAGSPDLEQRIRLLSLENELVLQDSAAFELAPLNLQPRDELVVYVEGRDNDTVNGPKVGRSRPVLIRITSAEDRHLALVEREDQVFEKLLEILGDYLENPIADMRVEDTGVTFHLGELSSAEYEHRYQAARWISQKVLELLGEMRELLALMQADDLMLVRDFELFQSIYERTYDLHRDEQNVLTSLGRPASRGALERPHMQRLDQMRTQQVRETEQNVLLLEEMVSAQRMASLERTMDELMEARQRLRDLLEQYRETNDPALREAIERELLRLQARMNELMQRMSELMREIPREHYNLEALQEMNAMMNPQEMADLLEQIRQAIDAGDFERALEMLDNLEAQMQAMLDQLGESQASGNSGLNELDQRMSELFDAINDLAAQEGEIEEATARLQEAIRERRIEALQEMLDEFVADARERVAAMRQELADVQSQELRQHITELLDQADDELEALDERLEAQDFESSLERSERALERLTGAGASLRGAVRRYNADSRHGALYEAAEGQVENLEEEARRLVDDLDELMRRARPTPDAGDRQPMQQIGDSQGQTLEQLQQLLERLDEMSQAMPMLGQELQPGLQGVERSMQGAESQLRDGQLQGAREDEQAALRQLQQMRQQMQQMVQREHMGQRQQQVSQERVEIPEEPDQTPSEFREDILDAMREESLDVYREAIRRYYESLVQ